ncbi:hypothetical protein [Streptomyces sp. NPDC056191]|uniref:hypothetical protein n=1 Tax=Streptomyces sp. NPDC056191 TaxID=3345742 RepID=UPI0035E33DA7
MTTPPEHPGSPEFEPVPIRVLLPDEQEVTGRMYARRQLPDGWLYLVSIKDNAAKARPSMAVLVAGAATSAIAAVPASLVQAAAPPVRSGLLTPVPSSRGERS